MNMWCARFVLNCDSASPFLVASSLLLGRHLSKARSDDPSPVRYEAVEKDGMNWIGDEGDAFQLRSGSVR